MPKRCNAARELSKHLQNPGNLHWDAIKYFAGYLKKESGRIHLMYCQPCKLRFIAMVNSNYAANIEDCKSMLCMIYTLRGTIIGWLSKTQRASTLSSTKMEYMAIASADQKLLFIQSIL